MLRRVLVAAAFSTFAFTQIASAADLGSPVYKAPPPPAAPVYNWTGFYAGVNVGYGWGDNAVNLSPNDPLTGLLFTTLGFLGEQPLVTSYSVRQKGAVGGFEAGYNWQAGSNWLWGLEADFSFSDINGQASSTSTLTTTGPGATQGTASQQNTDWFGTVRGRLGWLATPNLLLFGTGGLAYGKTTDTASYMTSAAGFFEPAFHGFSFLCGPSNSPCFTGTSTSTQVGWTAGGGAEWLVSQNVSFKVEYQFVDLGSETVRVTAINVFTAGSTPASFNAALRNEFQVVRLGLNYRF